MTTTLETKTLRNGDKVLAKTSRCGQLTAVRYGNRTQAFKKVEALMEEGYTADVTQPLLGKCFYVRILD